MADYGWAYVKHGLLTGSAGNAGVIQFSDGDGLAGSSNLTYDSSSNILALSGTINLSGAINATELNVIRNDVVVNNISVTGSTLFGNDAVDIHTFTGSMYVKGPVSSSQNISASYFFGNGYNLTNVPVKAYTNYTNNRILTSTDSETINGEANLTFNGTVLSVTGQITASVGISSSYAKISQLTASTSTIGDLTASVARIHELTVGTGSVSITGKSISGVEQFSSDEIAGTITTAAQTNITSLGTLSSLGITGDLTVDTNVFKVNSSTNKVSINKSSAPSKAFEIYDNSAAQLRLLGFAGNGVSTVDEYVDLRATNDGYLILSASGDRFGIGTAAPAHTLDIDGDARITGNLVVSGTLNARMTDFVISANTLVLGDAATDSITLNAATASVPNGLNIGTNLLMIDNSNSKVGVGTRNPSAKLESLSTTEQLRLSYNGSHNAKFSVAATGDLTIQPTGNSLTASSNFVVSGSSFLGLRTSDHTIVSGQLTASVGMSSSVGRFKTLQVSTLTDGTATMVGGNISGVGTLTATNLAGTLSTAAQGNVTSLGTLTSLAISGDLTVDTSVLKVNATTNKVSINKTSANKALEIYDNSAAQLRLLGFAGNGISTVDEYADLQATQQGHLLLSASSGRIGIGTTTPNASLAVTGNLRVTVASDPIQFNGVATGTATTASYLALDSSNNLILTSSGGFRNIYVSASILTYTNASNNRLVTSVDATSVNSEANLTFDGTILTVTGQVTASVGVSASYMKASELTSSTATIGELFGTSILGTTITDGAASITGGNISGVGTLTTTNVSASNVGGTLTTAAQTNITSLGTLSGLVISGDLTVDTNVLKVNSTSNKIAINKNTPNRALDIYDNSSPQLRLTGFAGDGISTFDKYAEITGDSDGYLILSSSGNRVGVNTGSPIAELDVSGMIAISSESSTPSRPADGKGFLYTKSDGKLYWRSYDLAETDITGGGSAVGRGPSGAIQIHTGSGGISGSTDFSFTNNIFTVRGGIIHNRRVVTSSITASADDYFLGVSSSSDIEIRMPDVSALSSGQTFTIKDEAGRAGISGSIKVSCQGAQTIDGFQSVLLESPNAAINVYSDGTSKYFIY